MKAPRVQPPHAASGRTTAGRPRPQPRCAEYPGGVPGLLAGAVMTAAASAALAGPEGEQVTHGQASFQRSGDLTVIHAANNTVINYRSFDIGAHEKVQFVQPDALSRVLNRINSAAPTRIDGALSANGRVYIVNPAGVMFGKGAVVDVARLYAAGGSIADADFLKHADRFTDLKGAVVNHGTISGDAVSLLGSAVANHGTIVADKGAVMMAAGDEIFLGEQGGHLYARIKSDGPAAAAAGAKPGVENSGEVRARRVSMSSGDLYSVAIRNTGTVKAKRIDLEGGTGGVVQAAGILDASGSAPGERGGEVRVLGDRVVLAGASVDASGDAGGGQVLIGGNVQGAGPERNAATTVVSPDSTIRADAKSSGDGGTVVVWSDRATGFYGSISARGAAGGAGAEASAGSGSSAGGFVETSSKGVLDMRGSVRAGNGGAWLIDPRDITIDDVPATTGGAFDLSGEFVPSADNAVVDSSEINANLDSGTSVKITTVDAGGSQAGNVTQLATGPIEKLVANGASLTIEAAGTITLQGGINAAPGTQAMDVTLRANTGADDLDTASGDVLVQSPVNTRGGDFNSSGVGFTSTAAGTITTLGGLLKIDHTGNVVVGGKLNADTGDVDIDATGPLATVTLNETVNTSAGDVTIDSAAGTTVTTAGDIGTQTGAVRFGVDGPGAITTGADITTQGGEVTFGRAVTLSASIAIGTNLGGSNGAVTFASTLDGPFDISVNAGAAAATFAGAIGDTTPLGDGVGAAIAIGSSSGPAVFQSTVKANSGITLSGSGSTTFTGDVTLGNGDTASAFAGDVVLDGLVFTAADGARFGDNPLLDHVVLSAGPVTLASTNAVFTFDAAVDGGRNLTINSGSAATTFNGPVGAVTPVGLGTGPAITLNTPAGLTTFNGPVNTAGLFIATGPVTFKENVAIGGTGISVFDSDVVLDGLQFSANAVRFGAVGGTNTLTLSGGDVSIVATGSGVQIEADVVGARDLTVSSVSGATFSGTVNIGDGTDASLILQNGGGTFNKDVITAAGVTLGSASEFVKKLTAAGPVTANGNVILRDDVTITGTGVSAFNSNVTLDGLAFSAPGVRFGSVATDRVTLSGGPVSITTTSVGAQFDALVDGAQNLTLSTAAGADFRFDVGATTPIGTGAAGSTAINVTAGLARFRGALATAERVTAAGAVEFRGDATLGGAGTSTFDNNVTFDRATLIQFHAPGARFGSVGGTDVLTLLNGPVSLSSTGGLQVEASVTGAHDLTVNAASGATFMRAVGASGSPLGDGTGGDAALTIQGGGAGFRSTVHTADPIEATGPVEFRDDVVVAGTGISTFNDDVAFNKAAGLSFTAPAVRFGTVSGTDAVTLLAGPVSLNTTDGGIQVEATVDGAQNLTLNAKSLADFRRPVGAATAIGTGAPGSTALTITGGGANFRSTLRTAERVVAPSFAEFRGNATIGGTGLSTFNANVTLNNMTFSAAGGAVFGDAAADQLSLVGSAVTVNSTNAPLTFNSRVDGPATLTTSSGTASTAFNAAVGATTRLAGLTSTVQSAGAFTSASTISTTGPVSLLGSGAKTLAGAVAADGGFSSVGGAFSNAGAPITTVDAPISISHAGAVSLAAPLTSGAGDVLIESDAGITATAAADVFTTTGSITHGATKTGSLTTAAAYNTTGGSVTFNRPVTITGPLAVDTAAGPTDGSVLFASSLNGGFDITINAGTAGTIFGGAVGASTAVGDGTGPALSLISTGSTVFSSTLAAQSGVLANGPVTFRDNVTLADGTFRTSIAGDVFLDGLTFNAADGAVFGDSAATDRVVLSGGPVVLTSVNSPFSFNAAVDGAQNLTIDAGTGITTFSGPVGAATPVGTGVGPAITLNSAGATRFNASVAAASGLDADGPVTFVGNVLLGDGDTASIFRGDVTMGRSGGMTFTALDGATFGDNAADQVTISAGRVTVLSTPANGPITFNAKIDSGASGPQALEINAGSGPVRLGGTASAGGVGAPVGSLRPLASLTITGSPITITADVTTLAGQQYSGPVSLGGTFIAGETFDFGQPVALLADASFLTPGSIFFRQSVATAASAGAPRGLRVESTGTQAGILFAGPVGAGSNPLASLVSINPGGLTTFAASIITTTGSQDYTGPIALDADAVFTAAAARFRGSIGAATQPRALRVQAPGGAVTLDSAVGSGAGGLQPLASLAVDAATLNLNGGTITTTGNQRYGAAVLLGAGTSLSSAGSSVAFDSTLDGAHDLVITAPVGTTTFAGDVGASTPLGDGSPATPVVIDSNVRFAGTGARTFKSRDGARFGSAGLGHFTVLDADQVAISAGPGNGSFTFDSTVTGAAAFDVNAGPGSVVFNGDIGPGGSTMPASVAATGSAIRLSNVTTTGPQTFNGATTLAGNLVSSGPGDITINGPATLAVPDLGIQTAGGASDHVTITGPVRASSSELHPNLTIESGGGAVTLAGAVGPDALTPGNIAISGSTIALPAVTSSGSQSYTGQASVSGNLTAGSSITFDGPASLLNQVAVTSPATVSFLGDLISDYSADLTAGAIVLGGDVFFGNTLLTTNAFNGPVSLINQAGQGLAFSTGVSFGLPGANMPFTMAGGPVTISVNSLALNDVAFHGPVDGPADLAINTVGLTTFAAPAGHVQPLGSLHVNFSTMSNGVVTTGPQTYGQLANVAGGYTALGAGSGIVFGADVRLHGNTAVQTASGPIDFAGPVNGPHNLAVNSGSAATSFTGPIGDEAPLGDGAGNALAMNSSGLTTFSGAVNTASAIFAAGPATFRENVTLGAGDGTASLFRGLTTLDGLDFTAVSGVTFAADVLAGGAATSISATDPLNGRVVLLRGLDAIPGHTPDVTITSGVLRQSGDGQALLDQLARPAIQLGPVGATTPLKSLTLGADLPVVPKEATILFAFDRNADGQLQASEIDATDQFVINTTGDFTMGQNQKATALGDLTINAGGDVSLGDLSSLGSINVNAGEGRQIRLLRRERTPGGIYDNSGSSGTFSADLGLDFVAAGDINFNTPPVGAGPTEVDFATNAGIRGLGLSDYSFRIFSGGVTPQLLTEKGGDTAATRVLSLDLRAQGPTETNIASAIAGALPRIEEGPEPVAVAISESIRVQLEQMGIFVKDLRMDEVIEFLVGRTVYRDVPLRIRPESGDFRISASRLPADAVELVVAKYLVLRDKAAKDENGEPIIDANGKPVMIEQWENIRDTFASAWSLFTQETGNALADGVTFRDWLQARYGDDLGSSDDEGAKALNYLNQLRELFHGLDGMGLSPREARYPKNKVIGDVAPPDMDTQQMEEAITGARVAPADEAAPAAPPAPASEPEKPGVEEPAARAPGGDPAPLAAR